MPHVCLVCLSCLLCVLCTLLMSAKRSDGHIIDMHAHFIFKPNKYGDTVYHILLHMSTGHCRGLKVLVANFSIVAIALSAEKIWFH